MFCRRCGLDVTEADASTTTAYKQGTIHKACWASEVKERRAKKRLVSSLTDVKTESVQEAKAIPDPTFDVAPKLISAKNPPTQWCGNCGTKRTEPGAFCGNCGCRF